MSRFFRVEGFEIIVFLYHDSTLETYCACQENLNKIKLSPLSCQGFSDTWSER